MWVMGVHGMFLMFNNMIALFLLVFLVIIVFFIVNALRRRRINAIDANMPVESVDAKVIEKNKNISSGFIDVNGMWSMDYSVGFETEQGVKTYEVSRRIFKSLDEGERGTLVFQGSRFINIGLH